MDIATILGLVICFGMVLVGVATSGGLAALPSYWDLPSVAITFGGSFSAVLASCSIQQFVTGIKSFSLILKTPKNDTSEMINNIIDLSNVARKEGLLSLEEAAGDLEDEFLKKGILLIVDGTDPELVRAIMETELVSMDSRHKAIIGFWESVAAMGPAWGMIGTLVGLVNMLNNMSDPDSIGPNMATALITTLYGSLLANWICAPVTGKLKTHNEMEMMQKEIMIEGLLSIQAGENPRVIEEKLKSFMSPSDRGSAENDGGEENG
ncbi:MAG: motility protein A [Lachnospiraceae bacterium]|nr:motility protein A [Lachnospiraceae bacterium]